MLAHFENTGGLMIISTIDSYNQFIKQWTRNNLEKCHFHPASPHFEAQHITLRIILCAPVEMSFDDMGEELKQGKWQGQNRLSD